MRNTILGLWCYLISEMFHLGMPFGPILMASLLVPAVPELFLLKREGGVKWVIPIVCAVIWLFCELVWNTGFGGMLVILPIAGFVCLSAIFGSMAVILIDILRTKVLH